MDIKILKDPDIKDALSTLVVEIDNLESTIEEKDEEILGLEKRIEELEAGVHDLVEKVKELEVALAEAYLTDEISEV